MYYQVANIFALLLNVFYVFDSNITKPRWLIEFANNNIAKVLLFFIAYLLAVHVEFFLALQLVVAVIYIDFDYKMALKSYHIVK